MSAPNATQPVSGKCRAAQFADYVARTPDMAAWERELLFGSGLPTP